jgi:predicted ATP-dependent endonuclease of OLD family
MKDIFETIQARSEQGNMDNVLRRLSTQLEALGKLLQRSRDAEQENGDAEEDEGEEQQPDWQLIEELENELAKGLSAVNPSASLRFDFYRNLPSAEDLFHEAVPLVSDGIECEPEKHGLGMQRSLILSTLNVWQKYVGSQEDDKDYLFAIEEPEIYLHPHAIRVMINTLETIARQDQVIFTTHANEFANRVPLENITILRRNGTRSCAAKPDLSEVDPKDLVKVRRYMVEDRSDMLFARSVILVEGQSELFALPSFARKMGYEIDRLGISIVFVGGYKNFNTYHQILDAFGIPHIFLGDDDGDANGRREEYEDQIHDLDCDLVHLLPHDFEHMVVNNLTDARLLEIISVCRVRRGEAGLPPQYLRPFKEKTTEEKVEKLLSGAKDSKPLLGRVLGEELKRDEIEQMNILTESLDKVLELAQNQ